ncbi:WYL domain-containing protein [Paenibacillus humicus]|uniref:WYL domain-containing protein n=1 Tax=Paenibacillus humicus TaxID=412861 RepID=UPI000FDA12AB|nr:WYL domain-containing protein [Paenibacillus humicus]
MNPFEKIFNYQIASRLEDGGISTVTSHERSWLKGMLLHPAASEALMPETRLKLERLLEGVQALEPGSALISRAGSHERQVYHPHLRQLRQLIVSRSGFRITYEYKNGSAQTAQKGMPYKLEYSMVKREWYLLWYSQQHRMLMRSRLNGIHSVQAETLETMERERWMRASRIYLESHRGETIIQIVREYNEELSRIMYAFSCFEKEVAYDAEEDSYRVTLSYPRDEQDFLLSKLRFLGKRVRIVQGHYLKQRMRETAEKALRRYGVEISEMETN